MDWSGLGGSIKGSLPTCLLVDPQLLAQMTGLANMGASLLLHVTFVFVRSISFSKAYLQTWNVASFHHSSSASNMWLPEFTWTEIKAIIPLKVWPWNPNDITCTAFFGAKQVTRPSQIQSVGSMTPPLESWIQAKSGHKGDVGTGRPDLLGTIFNCVPKAYPTTAQCL